MHIEHTYRVLSEISCGVQSQRTIAENLGYSLGKVNYLIKALAEKGLVKLENFSKSKNKSAYRYVLTPVGVKERYRITKDFLQRKEAEYEEIKVEIERLRVEVGEMV